MDFSCRNRRGKTNRSQACETARDSGIDGDGSPAPLSPRVVPAPHTPITNVRNTLPPKDPSPIHSEFVLCHSGRADKYFLVEKREHPVRPGATRLADKMRSGRPKEYRGQATLRIIHTVTRMCRLQYRDVPFHAGIIHWNAWKSPWNKPLGKPLEILAKTRCRFQVSLPRAAM